MNKQAFKRGYLFSLAANGLTPDRVKLLMEKKAAELGTNSSTLTKQALTKQALMPKLWVNPANILGGVGSAALKAIALPVTLGTAAGMAGGGLAYTLTKGDYSQHTQDLKDIEKINALRQEVLRVQRRLRRQREGTRRAPVA